MDTNQIPAPAVDERERENPVQQENLVQEEETAVHSPVADTEPQTEDAALSGADALARGPAPRSAQELSPEETSPSEMDTAADGVTAPVEAPLPEAQTELALSEENPTPAELDDVQLKAILEAAVYITDEPLSVQQIAAALGQSVDRVGKLLEQLVEEYNQPHRGLTVREVAGGYKMGTKPEHHEAVRNFVKNLKPPLKLSLAALETLAVIAYKQPITAPEIMEIRGVQGAGVLKTLLDRKLIATSGRKQVVGKPMLYKTTREFLVQFGLKDLSELPSLKEFEELGRLAMAEEEPEPPPVAPGSSEPSGEQEPAAPPVDAPEAQSLSESPKTGESAAQTEDAPSTGEDAGQSTLPPEDSIEDAGQSGAGALAGGPASRPAEQHSQPDTEESEQTPEPGETPAQTQPEQSASTAAAEEAQQEN